MIKPNGISQPEAIIRCCSVLKSLDEVHQKAEVMYGGSIQRTLVSLVRTQWERSRNDQLKGDQRFSSVYRPKGITQSEAIVAVCDKYGPMENIQQVHRKANELYGASVRYDLVSRVRRNWMVETCYEKPSCSVWQIDKMQAFLHNHGISFSAFENFIEKFDTKELSAAFKQVKCGVAA